jgi:hypothetical protein
VAVHLMGAGFLLVFVAVTAAGSAEQIAVSSLVASIVHRDCINNKALANSWWLCPTSFGGPLRRCLWCAGRCAAEGQPFPGVTCLWA